MGGMPYSCRPSSLRDPPVIYGVHAVPQARRVILLAGVEGIVIVLHPVVEEPVHLGQCRQGTSHPRCWHKHGKMRARRWPGWRCAFLRHRVQPFKASRRLVEGAYIHPAPRRDRWHPGRQPLVFSGQAIQFVGCRTCGRAGTGAATGRPWWWRCRSPTSPRVLHLIGCPVAPAAGLLNTLISVSTGSGGAEYGASSSGTRSPACFCSMIFSRMGIKLPRA